MMNQNGIPSKSTGDIIVLRVKNLLEADKIYLKTDLSLTSLSKLVGTNNSYLSKVINQEFGKSFSELIRYYRIKYAKALISTQSYKITELPQLCGFKARSSFNAAFITETGCTPSVYMRTEKLDEE